MPKPSTRNPARRMASSRSSDIASIRFVLMNCNCAGIRPLLLRRNDSLAQRQDPPVAREGEDIVLKDDRARARMRRDDPLDHGQAFVGFQARDRCDTALRLVQEIGGRAKRAAHRAIVERDQPHRADFRQVRLARRLARQRSDAVGRFQTLPIGRIRHLLVGCAVDRIAQLLSTQRTLRNREQFCRPGCGAPFR